MSPASIFPRVILVAVFPLALILNSCSYLPWADKNKKGNDDLAFEEGFPFEDESKEADSSDRRRGDDGSSEDNFFAGSQGFSDGNTAANELKDDVENLQSQQEMLISKVRELEEILSARGSETSVAKENMGGVASYDKALVAYWDKNYDESVSLFQNLSKNNPPEKLRANIVFWIGANYAALKMYDDAILQFETVLNEFPNGNKVHDSRYMIGRVYSKKGETARAIEILEDALKKNPPDDVRGKILSQLNRIQ